MAKKTTVADLFGSDIPETGVIRNQFGDSRDDEVGLIDELMTITPGAASISVEDLTSDDLETVEHAIDQLHQEIQSNTLLLSIAVHQMVEREVYKPMFQRPAEYFEAAPGRLHMSRSDLSYALVVGEAWARHHKRLLASGFRPVGDTTKLRYLAKAAELYGADQAINRLPEMSIRDYADWAKGEQAAPLAVEMTHVDVKIAATDKGIIANDRLVIKMTEVRRIVAEGSIPRVFGLYSDAEAKVVERALTEFRKKK